MEGPPPTTESGSEKKESRKPKKKDAEAIGAVLFKSPLETGANKKPAQRESFLAAFEKQETAAPKPEADKSVDTTSEDGSSAETSGDTGIEQVTNPGEISQEETQYVEQQTLQAWQAEQPADIEPIETFRRKVIEEGEDSDTALEETLTEFGFEDSQLDVENSDVSDEVPEAVDTEPQEFGDEEIQVEKTPQAEQQRNELHESEADEPEAEAETTATSSGAGGGGTVPPTGRGGQGGSVPPHGPQPPFHPNFGPAGAGAPVGYNPNAVATPPTVEYYENGNAAGTALLMGIVGYLIGRRRGRIKTEKKLLPVQKKLQAEVVNLQTQLQVKEAQIRRAAIAKQRLERSIPLQVATAERKAQKEHAQTRPVAVEARQLHGKQQAQEHIGHMLVTAEAPLAERKAVTAQEKTAKPKPETKLASGKRIETLNRAELLEMSDKIIIEGSSLRQIYETHLVGERGLRRLVAEHLRGGDLKKALRREIVEREIDFERDPVMRDQATASTGGGGGGAATTLGGLLQQAGVVIEGGSEEVAFLKARAAYEAHEQAQAQKQRRMVDISLAGTIAILVAAIALLVITHH